MLLSLFILYAGVFSVPQEMGDDSFGEFQGLPPPSQPSGMGVVPTSSYTRPIPSVSGGSPVIGERYRSTSSPHLPRVHPQPVRSVTHTHTHTHTMTKPLTLSPL